MLVPRNGSKGDTNFFTDLIDRDRIVVDVEVETPDGGAEKRVSFTWASTHGYKEAEKGVGLFFGDLFYFHLWGH
jgi:hypothetical protein